MRVKAVLNDGGGGSSPTQMTSQSLTLEDLAPPGASDTTKGGPLEFCAFSATTTCRKALRHPC